jgi:four helix bundle protein
MGLRPWVSRYCNPQRSLPVRNLHCTRGPRCISRRYSTFGSWNGVCSWPRCVIKSDREEPQGTHSVAALLRASQVDSQGHAQRTGTQDRRFLGQIRGSIRSACNLTSEGFYRKRDGDFINYLVMARGSLGEASDQIDDGAESKYFTDAERDEMIIILKRAMAANRELRRYLESCQSRRKSEERRRTRRPEGPTDPGTQGPTDPGT